MFFESLYSSREIPAAHGQLLIRLDFEMRYHDLVVNRA
jgi:hypothetical protein